jgi:hypothetical protein
MSVSVGIDGSFSVYPNNVTSWPLGFLQLVQVQEQEQDQDQDQDQELELELELELEPQL